MSIKPQYTSYRYTDEITVIKSQSQVECRLPGSEIGSILSVQTKAVTGECVCENGEVRYGGKLLLCVAYEDGERKICRAERGVEFFHKAEDGLVTPACFAKLALTPVSVSQRREGSGLYISAIVQADINVYGSKSVDYLEGGEGLVCKRKTQSVFKSLCISGETEGEDEFEADYIGDVLLYGEKVLTSKVKAENGQVSIEGEIALHVCALKGEGGVCSYERILPFYMQIPSEEAANVLGATARVRLKNTKLTAGVDEEKDRSKWVYSYCLVADCFLHFESGLEIVEDAFAPSCETACTVKKGEGRYLTKSTVCTQRLRGEGVISPQIEGEYTLAAALMPKAELSCKKLGAITEVEGAITADLLLFSTENGYRTAKLTMPVALSIDISASEVCVEGLVSGLTVKRQGETAQVEATLKLCAHGYEVGEWAYVGEVIEGEKREEKTAAISIFLPKAGEDLWTVAKGLCRTPEELQRTNPDLQFPVKEGERIFVYRQAQDNE